MALSPWQGLLLPLYTPPIAPILPIFAVRCRARRFHQLRDRKLAQAAAACEKLINDATVRLASLARQEGTTVERMQASRMEGVGVGGRQWSGPCLQPVLP